jgi:TonB family protein
VRTLFFALFVSSFVFCVSTQARTPVMSVYPDSADGFRQQLEALISSFNSRDRADFRADLETLVIPDSDQWIANHFPPANVPKLQRSYRESFAVFERHLYSVIEDSAQLSSGGMTAKSWGVPLPPNQSEVEQGIPSPFQSIPVECFGYGALHPKLGVKSSWVSSFVYMEGMFRYVGGSYPFWWEELKRLRLPQSQAEQYGVQSARILHKVTPEYPKKARKEHIEGAVRLHAIIGKDGAIRELIVVSGHPLLTDAALKAVRQWRYEPTLLLGQPVEVDTTIDVFFALNQKPPSQN